MQETRPRRLSALRSVVAVGRSSLLTGWYAAWAKAVGAYVVGPHAEAFARSWARASAVPGWLSELNAAAIFEVITELQARTVVEIGSYLGRSTVLMALAQREAGVAHPRLVAIDPHTGDRQHLERLGVEALPSYDLFNRHVEAAGVRDSVAALVERSEDVGRRWSEPIDFLYIDGWHSYDAVLADGRLFLPHLTERGVVVFDDYLHYPELQQAVHDLEGEGTLHLWGVVFGQAVGGRSPTPVAAVERVMKPSRMRRRFRILRRERAHS